MLRYQEVPFNTCGKKRENAVSALECNIEDGWKILTKLLDREQYTRNVKTTSQYSLAEISNEYHRS